MSPAADGSADGRRGPPLRGSADVGAAAFLGAAHPAPPSWPPVEAGLQARRPDAVAFGSARSGAGWSGGGMAAHGIQHPCFGSGVAVDFGGQFVRGFDPANGKIPIRPVIQVPFGYASCGPPFFAGGGAFMPSGFQTPTPPVVPAQGPFGFAGGGAFMPSGFQTPTPPVVPAQGYYQSLLHGVSAPGVQELTKVRDAPSLGCSSQSLSASSNGESSGQYMGTLSPSSVSATKKDTSGAVPRAEEVVEVDSDEEEEVYGDDEVLSEGADDEADEAGFESSDEDAEHSDEDEDSGDETATPDNDEGLQYEILPTALGDCGCVSTNAAYKKRVRWPKGVHPPDCRAPRDMGAIEKAMRNSKNRTTTHIFEPVLGMVFDSRAEAYNFFNLYSWEVGFGIRFGTSSRNRVNKYRTMQEIVCEKEGFDPRCTSSSKRQHCKAMLRLHRSQDHGWYVSKHVKEHNHPLSVSCAEKREWKSHSKIEQCTKDMIRYLRENNVSLSRVHCIMGSMFGSMQNIPFNQKSLRAICAEIARDHKDDDVAKTLEVFRKMRAEDPGFQFSVQLDEQKKIKTLIWTSGRSRSQYSFFGDAVTFDTTYCTNLYKMPFGMFVGVNNHFQSVLFAGVLMRDETAKSFKWVFNEFITLMGGKAPKTILTDQCKAMTKAIREVLTETEHLWCKWHIFKDAPEELGPVYRRNGPFRKEFHFVINQMLTEDEFERAWDDLLDRYNLREHPFMLKAYKKKKMWAKPWCKDIFCARMASTQRSESANSILKKVIPRNCSMNRFVEQYRKLLFIRASAEDKAEHKTKQYQHRGSRVYAIEKHALSLYTNKVCQLFSKEVDKSAAYNVVQGDCSDELKVVHYNEEDRKKWARSVFTVKTEEDGSKLKCECGHYEHFGILCCHAIKVLIHFGAKKIPEAHIMKRWTRAARDFEYTDVTSSGLVDSQLRNSVLYVNALDVVRSSEKDAEAAEILMSYLSMAKKEIQRMFDERNKDSASGYTTTVSDTEDGDSDYEVEDNSANTYGAAGSSAYMSDADIQGIQAPEVRQTAGRPRENRYPRMFERFKKGKKRSRHPGDASDYCERCDETGHVRSTCKLKAKTKQTTKKKSARSTAARTSRS